MEISRCDIMSVGKLEPEEIVAVISVVLLSGELGGQLLLLRERTWK